MLAFWEKIVKEVVGFVGFVGFGFTKTLL